MRKIRTQLGKSIALVTVSLSLSASAFAAEVVYDNSLNSQNRSYSPGNGVEFGDEIVLSGTDRVIQDFAFEYYLSASSGNETAQLRFYQNDQGADPNSLAPGTLLYDSGPFALNTGFSTALASGLGVLVPDRFTWTITFSGIDGTEEAGLQIYDPPTIGQSFRDFWQRTGGDWSLFLIENGDVPGNFSARVTAVPEPTTMALILVGLGFLGFRAFKRRN